MSAARAAVVTLSSPGKPVAGDHSALGTAALSSLGRSIRLQAPQLRFATLELKSPLVRATSGAAVGDPAGELMPPGPPPLTRTVSLGPTGAEFEKMNSKWASRTGSGGVFSPLPHKRPAPPSASDTGYLAARTSPVEAAADPMALLAANPFVRPRGPPLDAMSAARQAFSAALSPRSARLAIRQQEAAQDFARAPGDEWDGTAPRRVDIGSGAIQRKLELFQLVAERSASPALRPAPLPSRAPPIHRCIEIMLG